MRVGQAGSWNRIEVPLPKVGDLLQQGLLVAVVVFGLLTLSGCAGLVSGAGSTSNPPPPSALQITNVQVASATTSTCQIAWTTDVPADSAVDYGTSTSYGASTTVDPNMVTNHAVTISGLAPAATYYYQVRSTDSKSNHGQSGGHTFKTSGLSLSGAISPAAGGSGATVTLGGAANATATADSSGSITGATAASYSTPATTTADSGSSFRVLVSNSVGSVTSGPATLTVNAAPVAPTIIAQPANQTVTAGQTATFTVVATGTAPLSYQWQKNGVNIAGATAANYTTPVTMTSDTGSVFRVVVSNSVGPVTSGQATLTVNAAPAAPTITAQPANQTVTSGQTATFTVAATGAAPLNYQWVKNGVTLAGATAASYTTPATLTSDSGSTFAAVISNTAGTVTSNAATLTVNAPPAPAIQVSPTPINFGNAVVGTNLSQALIVKNTGTATLTISQVTATGSGFSASGFTLPLNVSAGQQTTITVAFLPTAVGPVSGNISITSNASTSPTSVGLSGTGIAATLTLGISPTTLSFGNITTGTSSATQNVVISDTGNSSVTISQIALSGTGYSMTGGSAPVTLNPSQSITLSVQFSPTVTGAASGNISIVSNATGSPTSVSLSGTGVTTVQHSVALSWGASPSTVVGYNVYRSTVSGSLFARVNSSTVAGLAYTDTSVQSGTTYYYVATAVDAAGNESVFSNQVQAVIP